MRNALIFILTSIIIQLYALTTNALADSTTNYGGSLKVVMGNTWYNGPVMTFGVNKLPVLTIYNITASVAPYTLTTQICKVQPQTCYNVSDLSGSTTFFNNVGIAGEWQFKFKLNGSGYLNKTISLHQLTFSY